MSIQLWFLEKMNELKTISIHTFYELGSIDDTVKVLNVELWNSTNSLKFRLSTVYCDLNFFVREIYSIVRESNIKSLF